MKLPTFHNKSVRWLIAELLIVVLGILIAFQIEEFRVRISDRALEQSLVGNLIVDLERYIRDFEAFNRTLTTSLESSVDVIEHLESGQPRDPNLLIDQFSNATRVWNWRTMSPAYDGWRNSNRPNLISNEELRTDLQSFFDSYLAYFEIRSQRYIQVQREFISVSFTEFTRRLARNDKAPPFESSIILLTPADEFPSNSEFLVKLDHHAYTSNSLYREINNRGLPLAIELREELVAHLETLN